MKLCQSKNIHDCENQISEYFGLNYFIVQWSLCVTIYILKKFSNLERAEILPNIFFYTFIRIWNNVYYVKRVCV